jgi:hypothetical protein
MKRMILVCWLCLAATSVYAESIETNWIKDKKTGCQVLTFKAPPSDASISWSGECKDGKANGNGVLKFYEKDKIMATIEGRMIAGQCIHDCSVGTIKGLKYVGDLYNGTMNGNGVMKRPDGLSCSGKFKDGYFQKGTIDYPDGSDYRKHLGYSTYTGEAKGTHPHGEGIMTYQNGDKYSGGWSEGKEHGKGTYTFKDGTSYEGLWEHGERIKIF